MGSGPGVGGRRGARRGRRAPPPAPVLSGALGGAGSAPGATRSSAGPPSAPLWGGGLRPGAERSGAAAPRGGSEASGPRGAGGGQARGAPLWRTPGGQSMVRGPPAGRVSLRAGGRADGRTREAAAACGKLAGAWSRPAALSSNYRADRSAAARAARSTCQAEGDRRRATRAGVPRGTFLERDGVDLFFKGRFVAWIFLGAPKAIKK